MTIELKIPSAGESITEVIVSEWLKPEGAWVEADEAVAMIETDKANVEVIAPKAGKLSKVLKQEGDTATVGEVIGHIDETAEKPEGADSRASDGASSSAPAQTKASAPPAPKAKSSTEKTPAPEIPRSVRATPAARRAIRETGLDVSELAASHLSASDVERLVSGVTARAPAGSAMRTEEAMKMTPMRKRIAQRLVEAQQTAAILTTFNEVDMTAVIALRKKYQDSFVKRYGIKLGFMSFFIKAAIEALKEFPAVNAEIKDEQIVYKNFYDIGVAVGGGRGLVVPVIRSAERLSFNEIEAAIADLGQRAKANRITPDELQGGTFTLSNGGIYGSLLSTPILNPPQSGILGMHAIQDRAVVIDGEIVVRKMMYLALSYDHRIVDGREAVSFLVRIKQAIEDPTRILLEV